jgi:hypothetical protein
MANEGYNKQYIELRLKLFAADPANTTQDNVLKGLKPPDANNLSADLSALESEYRVLLSSNISNDPNVPNPPSDFDLALGQGPERREKFLGLITGIEAIHKRSIQAIHRHASGIAEESQGKLHERVDRFARFRLPPFQAPKLEVSLTQMTNERLQARDNFAAQQNQFNDEPGKFLAHLRSQISLLEREKQFIEQVKNSYLDFCQTNRVAPDNNCINDYNQQIQATTTDINQLKKQADDLTARYKLEYDYVVELKNQLTEAYVYAFNPCKLPAANTLEDGFFTGVGSTDQAQAIVNAQKAGKYASTMKVERPGVGGTTEIIPNVPANRPEQYNIFRLGQSLFSNILPIVSVFGLGSELTYTMDNGHLTGFISFNSIQDRSDAIGFAEDLTTLLTNMYNIAPPKNGYDFEMGEKGIKAILAKSLYFSKQQAKAVDVFLIENVIKPFLLAAPPVKNPCMVFKGIDSDLLKQAHKDIMTAKGYTPEQITQALLDVDYKADKDATQHPAYEKTSNPIPPAPASTPGRGPTVPRDSLLRNVGNGPGQDGSGGPAPTSPPDSPSRRPGPGS